MNVELHIERIVLDGLPLQPGQATLLQAAVQAELARLLGEGALAADLAAGGAWPRLSAGGIALTETSGPAEIGRQIAQVVYGGIGR